jgi:hypothetical protein
MQIDIEQRAVDFQMAFIFDEAELAETCSQETDSGHWFLKGRE